MIHSGNIVPGPFYSFYRFPAGINQATNTGQVPFFEFFYMGAGLNNLSYDFVTGNHGENAGKPVVADLMQIGMAYTAINNFQLNIMWAHIPPFKIPGSQICDSTVWAAYPFV